MSACSLALALSHSFGQNRQTLESLSILFVVDFLVNDPQENNVIQHVIQLWPPHRRQKSIILSKHDISNNANVTHTMQSLSIILLVSRRKKRSHIIGYKHYLMRPRIGASLSVPVRQTSNAQFKTNSDAHSSENEI